MTSRATFCALVVATIACIATVRANAQSCVTFEQTRWTTSTRTVDKTTCYDLQLSSLPEHISDKTVILQFGKNRLTFLHRDMFTRFPLLEEADFSRNEIVHIGYNLTSLTLTNLSLSANKLRTVPNGTFEHMPNLIHLDLSGNEIWILFSYSFRQLTKLQILDVSNNLITNIDGQAFAPLVSLRVLNLAANLLETLPTDMDGSISPELRSITLGSNRWTCDCHTLWLKVLLTEHNVLYDKQTTLCTKAAVTSALGKRWHELRYAEFACAPALRFPTDLETKELHVGSSTVLECRFNMSLPVSWKRYDARGNVMDISSSSSKFSVTQTTRKNLSSTLTIFNLAEGDSGVYFCEAVNLVGAVSANFTLRVREQATVKDRQLIAEPKRSEVSAANEEGIMNVIGSNTVNLLALIGALVGIIVIIIVVVAGIVYCVQLVAARGVERRQAEAATPQLKHSSKNGLSKEDASDRYRDGSPLSMAVPNSMTTLTLLPQNHSAASTLNHSRYVSIQTQHLGDAFANKAVNCLADGRPGTRSSAATLNCNMKVGSDSHSGRTSIGNPYVTLHHQGDACPVHGTLTPARHALRYRQDFEEYCPVHDQNAPASYVTPAAYHHCPVHGIPQLFVPNDAPGAGQLKPGSAPSTPELVPLNDFQLMQTSLNSENGRLPTKLNLPVDDSANQTGTNVKEYCEETDIDADLNDSKSDGMNTIIRKPCPDFRRQSNTIAVEMSSSIQPYSTSV